MLKPFSSGKWNFSTAAHLLNRAGFGGPPAEIEKLASFGLEQAVAYLVDYEKIPDPTADPEWAKPHPTRPGGLMEARRASEGERRRIARGKNQAPPPHI